MARYGLNDMNCILTGYTSAPELRHWRAECQAGFTLDSEEGRIGYFMLGLQGGMGEKVDLEWGMRVCGGVACINLAGRAR